MSSHSSRGLPVSAVIFGEPINRDTRGGRTAWEQWGTSGYVAALGYPVSPRPVPCNCCDWVVEVDPERA